MLLSKMYKYGPLQVTIYDFENEGDILDMHTHGEDDVHISIIARGSLSVFTPNSDRTLKNGAVLDWQAGEWHGFKALEPKSRLINIVKK